MANMATDMVCGMEVDPAKAKAENLTSEHKGKTFYFCSDECKTQFEAKPEEFAGEKKKTGAKGSASRQMKSGGAKAQKTGAASGQKKQSRMK